MTAEDRLDRLYYVIKGIIKAYRADGVCNDDNCQREVCDLSRKIEVELEKLCRPKDGEK